jgi:hypothetical protein
MLLTLMLTFDVAINGKMDVLVGLIKEAKYFDRSPVLKLLVKAVRRIGGVAVCR